MALRTCMLCMHVCGVSVFRLNEREKLDNVGDALRVAPLHLKALLPNAKLQMLTMSSQPIPHFLHISL